MGIVFFILAVIFVWLIAITLLLLRVFNFFRKLSKDVDTKNLVEILKGVLEQEGLNAKGISSLQKALDDIASQGKVHIQKVGVIRFNPFEELGGDHSFSVALLDGNDTGVIITGLHTRERTRVYLKELKRGKPNIELSREEKKALSIAQKL